MSWILRKLYGYLHFLRLLTVLWKISVKKMIRTYGSANEALRASFLTLAMLCIALVPMCIGSNLSKEFAPYILAIYTLLGFSVFWIKGSALTILSPNSLVFFYSTISLILGSVAFKFDAVLVTRNLADFQNHQHTDSAFTFIMIGLTFFPLIEVVHKSVFVNQYTDIRFSKSHLAVLSMLTLPLVVLNVDLAMVGGAGSLSPYLLSLVSIACLIFASKFTRFTRLIIYMLTFATMVSIFSQDKRVAIFLLLVISLLEARRGAFILNFKGLVFVILIIVAALYAILLMSINRGYGGYVQAEGVIAASSFVLDYMKSDIFLAGFFQNIEVSYFYFHYLNAAELVFSGKVELALGSTLIKPLFLPFPRDILPWKPSGIIDLYTFVHDPAFRLLGGSWPPNFAAEYLWNFHVFGLILFPILATINAVFFRVLLSRYTEVNPFFMVFMLFAYMNVLTYARGSGLDLIAFLLIIAGVFTLFAASVHETLRFAVRNNSMASHA